MNNERRRQIDSLFDEVLDQDPEDRASFLTRHTRDDPDLKSEIEALLRAHDKAEGVLELSAADAASSLLPAESRDERIGNYRIVRELGRGGMAIVYLGERDDGQYTQRVAIKVIRAGGDPTELDRRFRMERQILATLDHPNIARLLDGGITDDRRPFLVMEYVEGLPIDQFADRRRMSIDERLELFCTVGRAVQHAHRLLIVHRDLKPSNILVKADGEVKLLDFGIAKILDPTLVGEAVPETRTGLRLMTPEYASPEQIRGEGITTANDVYTLGVILYQLLVGRRPFAMEGKPLSECEKMVLEDEPTRPSTVALQPARPGEVNATVPTPEVLARDRGIQPRRLQRRLQGELDRIVLMALRKEPERRYYSVEQMVEDVRLHLEGRPVIAQGDSVGYRTRKFVTRNRWWVGTAALLTLSLVGGVASTSIQASRAAVQRDLASMEADRAARVTSILVDLFRLSDPNQTLGNTITAREVLEQGTSRIEGEFRDQPEVQADLLTEVARIYMNLGIPARAEDLTVRALELRETIPGAEAAGTAASLGLLADVQASLGKRDAAIENYQRAIDIGNATSDATDTTVARLESSLAWELRSRGESDSAAVLFRNALDTQRSLLGDDHPDVATSLLGLASALHDGGAFDEALDLFRSVLDRDDSSLARPRPVTATALFNIGMINRLRGEFRSAEPLVESALEMRDRLYDPGHPDLIEVQKEMGTLWNELGHLAQADSIGEAGLQWSVRTLGPEHTQTSEYRELLAHNAMYVGRFDLSAIRFDSVIANKIQRLGPDHPGVVFSSVRAGEPHLLKGDLAEARRRFTDAIDLAVRVSGLESTYRMLGLDGLARVALAEGDLSAARGFVDQAHTMAVESLRPGHRYRLDVSRTLARVLIGEGRLDEAQVIVESVLQNEEAVRPEPHFRRAATHVLAALIHEARGDRSAALQAARAARANQVQMLSNHPAVREVEDLLRRLEEG